MMACENHAPSSSSSSSFFQSSLLIDTDQFLDHVGECHHGVKRVVQQNALCKDMEKANRHGSYAGKVVHLMPCPRRQVHNIPFVHDDLVTLELLYLRMV
mmetsp:Transcript_893/g.1756  ORF Transcript_893/g.1756 Transcript_893/m.1756 type:complete len:99 (-) Transcript_893:614-910(-)